MSGRALVGSKYMETAQSTQYTVPAGVRTLIDAVQLANDSGANATFSINVVSSGGAAGVSNRLYPITTILSGSRVTVLAGTWLNQGDFISTIAGSSAAIVMHIGGREFVIT